MDIELLKKLIRLANNNPNENEANSAARKVCDLLKDSDLLFEEDNPKYGSLHDIFNYARNQTSLMWLCPKCLNYYPIGVQHICN